MLKPLPNSKSEKKMILRKKHQLMLDNFCLNDNNLYNLFQKNKITSSNFYLFNIFC